MTVLCCLPRPTFREIPQTLREIPIAVSQFPSCFTFTVRYGNNLETLACRLTLCPKLLQCYDNLCIKTLFCTGSHTRLNSEGNRGSLCSVYSMSHEVAAHWETPIRGHNFVRVSLSVSGKTKKLLSKVHHCLNIKHLS